MDKLLASLSPIEQKVVPYLKLGVDEIVEKSKLDRTSVLRALGFLENKGVLKINVSKEEIVELGTNGIYYMKNHLPERRLLLALEEKNHLPLQDAKKFSKLSDNEFKVSLGVLKKKMLINLANGKLSLAGSKEELVKKFPEEMLLEKLPCAKKDLKDLELLAFDNLLKRKDVVFIEEQKAVNFKLSESGQKIAGKKVNLDLVEEVTSEMIKSGAKGKRFRAYDIQAQTPKIYGGKKHFVNQSIEYAKKIWTDLGFEEMEGDMVQTAFWNFDALFTAQDHPVREMQDTFYVKGVEGKLPDREIVDAVKKSHEKGVSGSKGWGGEWSEDQAKRVVMRTHTTCLSALTLAKLAKEKGNLPKKFFAVGKCFRNETVDWSHGFEFNQTEGIVVDENANFRNLLGYLKEFFSKMGFEKIRFVPAYFPYTEPSVEIAAYHPEKKVWLELGGAGIFRPEVTVPLLGKHIPILAWGPGFDRIMMDFYKIKDLRELYENNIKVLRDKRMWTR